MIPRQDELANAAELERDQGFRRGLKGVAQTAAGLATTAAGSGIASRVLPFLNEFIPADLAIKGISKISPKIGDFLKRGQAAGLDIEEGLNFVKNKMAPKQEEESGFEVKGNRNIIEQYDPELHTYLDQKIKEGQSPVQAATQALKHGRFKKAAKKITKDHKTDWIDIVKSIYGMQKQKKSTQQEPQQQQQQQQPAQQQAGPGQAALMEVLKKLQQSRGVQ
jgi:pyruvate/2-oxoglutarate dehydrogenase complex dihydrolipoamide acyltransferase (E2) component